MTTQPTVPVAPTTAPGTLPLPLEDGAVLIDATAFDHYTNCRRSFQYYFIHKRQLGGRKSALEAGSIFHALMEHRRRWEGKKDLLTIEHEQEQLAHLYYAGWATAGSPAIGQLLDSVSDHPTMCERYPGFTPSLDDFRTESNMIDAIRAYNKNYQVEPFELVRDASGEPLVEIPFAYPIVTLAVPALYPQPVTVYWTGRIDLPVRYPDGLWNSDIKTGTRDNGFDEFANDQAQIGYLWALRKHLGETPQGFMIDKVFWRPPTKTGKGIEFKRHRERIEPERIDEWEHNTIAIIEDIFRDATRGYFPMETKNHCVGKYGTCPFLMVCKLPPAGRSVMLSSDFYQTVTWSPLRKTAK
jgi:hypothetical protein